MVAPHREYDLKQAKNIEDCIDHGGLFKTCHMHTGLRFITNQVGPVTCTLSFLANQDVPVTCTLD